MKKLTKSIIASILCAVIAITAIATVNTTTAYAESDKTPLKVTIKGKTVTLVKDINTMQGYPKVKTLKKKWGKPDTSGQNPEMPYYLWTKGKTRIDFSIFPYIDNPTARHPYIQITSSDKKFKVNGIKLIGMKQKKAKKILKNLSMEINNFDTSDEARFEVGDITCHYEKGKVSQVTVTILYLWEPA